MRDLAGDEASPADSTFAGLVVSPESVTISAISEPFAATPPAARGEPFFLVRVFP